MKCGGMVVTLVFGILGTVYAVIGGVLLTLAARLAGSMADIFSLPEGELALAVCGTVFGVLGAGFLLVTAVLLLRARQRKRLREELLTWGARVKGTVTDVRIDYSIHVNGHSPLVARVRCPFPSGEAILRSPRLWKASPSTGDTVEILYDPMDERKFVMLFEGE